MTQPNGRTSEPGHPLTRSPALSGGGTAPPDDRLLVRPKGRANQRMDADPLRGPVIRRGRWTAIKDQKMKHRLLFLSIVLFLLAALGCAKENQGGELSVDEAIKFAVKEASR